MWIYNQNVSEEMHPAVPVQAETACMLPAVPEEPVRPIQTEESARPGKSLSAFPARDCGILMAAFLLGTIAAGVLCARYAAARPEWLQSFLRHWLALFSASDAHAATALFAVEYLTLAAAATVLLLLGFSACGPVLIFLFTMFYGAGNGLLTIQLLSGADLRRIMPVFLLTALPAAVASACLLFLGTHALQISGQVRAYFLRRSTAPCEPGASVLVRQYMLTLVLILPLCGVAAGLARLESILP